MSESEGGRERGPRGLARAWLEVVIRPRRFFRNGVAPGEQAPALVFAITMAVVYTTSRFLLVPATRPRFFPSEAASVAIGVLVVALVLAPAALHILASVQTLFLIAGAPDRAGVSETVQILAYATAPCALAGVGVPPGLGFPPATETVVAIWRIGCTLWGTGLLVYGIHEVHNVGVPRALLLAALPALAVFGYLFGGLFAVEVAFGVELVDSTPPGR